MLAVNEKPASVSPQPEPPCSWLRPPCGSTTDRRVIRRHYWAQQGWKQDPILAAASKELASRFYQLKSGHAAIGPYLQGIGARESKRCQGCQAPEESVRHLLLECREWQRARENMTKALRKAGVNMPSAENAPEERLLGDYRATKAILAETTATYPQGAEREASRTQREEVETERAGEG
jgi:hypothetical protein